MEYVCVRFVKELDVLVLFWGLCDEWFDENGVRFWDM